MREKREKEVNPLANAGYLPPQSLTKDQRRCSLSGRMALLYFEAMTIKGLAG